MYNYIFIQNVYVYTKHKKNIFTYVMSQIITIVRRKKVKLVHLILYNLLTIFLSIIKFLAVFFLFIIKIHVNY